MASPVVEQLAVRPGCQWGIGTNDQPRLIRVPDVIIPLNALGIAAETSVWTPTGSRFVRLLGYCLSSGGTQGNITVKDNTGGNTVLIIPKMAADTPTGVVYIGGGGVVSSFPTFPITFTGVATQTVSGFLFGCEELPL